MKTPEMFYPQEDGKLVEIPAEHAAILELYRDRMPVVWEIQETGPHYLYPLIDVDAEPVGTPEPSRLENATRRAADYLKAQRLGKDPIPPDFEQLAAHAIYAHVTRMAEFGAAVAFGDGPAAEERSARAEAAGAGRVLTKTVERAVRETITETRKQVSA
ncbi:hypothetical protein AB0N99_21195 [Streptomyces sp. NPDC093272]|uniref:hypothetical protein n=1 Tax=Streptomyces sp. NPDC093272 TaxID=3154981 RepID=UPI003441E0EF